jgi:hypothetical protein
MMTLTNKAQWLATQSDADKIALGGFFTALLRAYAKADTGNRARIEQAFRDTIEHEFGVWYKRVE